MPKQKRHRTTNDQQKISNRYRRDGRTDGISDDDCINERTTVRFEKINYFKTV